jgi:hypothetical protein
MPTFVHFYSNLSKRALASTIWILKILTFQKIVSLLSHGFECRTSVDDLTYKRDANLITTAAEWPQ